MIVFSALCVPLEICTSVCNPFQPTRKFTWPNLLAKKNVSGYAKTALINCLKLLF